MKDRREPSNDDERVNEMKRTLSFFLMLCMLFSCAVVSYADGSQQNAVYELYSADGYYEDGVGNQETYTFHVPQINADTKDAGEINAEIKADFGGRVEEQFKNMDRGTSLWSWHTEWEAFWNGSQLFLLITADMNGDNIEYGAYGYDFEAGKRVTNDMIFSQKGISEEQYMEKLREAVSVLFDELYVPVPEGATISHDSLLEDTLSWLSVERPVFLNRYGEIETWVEIAAPAGAGKYAHLITPFSANDDQSFNIKIIGDTDLVEACPESAKPGETVTVITYDVTDGDKKISVSGADGESINWFEYQFVMPDHDVEVHVEFIGNGLA